MNEVASIVPIVRTLLARRFPHWRSLEEGAGVVFTPKEPFVRWKTTVHSWVAGADVSYGLTQRSIERIVVSQRFFGDCGTGGDAALLAAAPDVWKKLST